MKKLIVLSGAGISKESGIPTFRDNDGLWKSHKFEDVASPMAWQRNPELVLDFYNFRRKLAVGSQPNKAHLLLAELQKQFDVQIITQNVDDLHERAGSKNIVHLHGEIRKARSVVDEKFITEIKGTELNIGDLCPNGSQLRPHIVWFGESVPNISKAIGIIKTADIFLVVGTGLQVYPAAGLIDYVPKKALKFIIDPSDDFYVKDYLHFKSCAVTGMIEFCNYLIKNNL